MGAIRKPRDTNADRYVHRFSSGELGVLGGHGRANAVGEANRVEVCCGAREDGEFFAPIAREQIFRSQGCGNGARDGPQDLIARSVARTWRRMARAAAPPSPARIASAICR